MKQRIQLMLQFLLFIFISTTLEQPVFAGSTSSKKHRSKKEKISFIPAQQNHVEQLYAIYDQISDEDKRNLVIVPQQGRREYLENAIEQEHFFIALNPAGNIIGLIKLYCENNPEKQRDILHNEIKAQAYCPEITLFESEEVLKQPHICPQEQTPAHDLPGCEKSIFLYYGGAYTAPAYRKQGINQKLLEFAMAYIYMNSPSQQIQHAQYILCSYGQVLANKDSIAIVYACTQAARLLRPLKDIIRARRYRYEAFKPELVYNEQKQEIEAIDNLQQNKGFGNVLVIDLDEEPKPFEKYQSMKG